MPAALKVVVAVNILSVVAIVLLALAMGGGFVSGVFPENEGHEIKLIPITPEDGAKPPGTPTFVQRAEIPPEYRPSDLTQSPWIVFADGSVRFVKND